MAIAAFAHRPSHPLGFASCSIRFIVCSPLTALTLSHGQSNSDGDAPAISRGIVDTASSPRNPGEHLRLRVTTCHRNGSPHSGKGLTMQPASRFLVEALAQKTSVACCLCRLTV